MRQLEPVIWTRGTFLNPQHLQMQDRFLENSLQFHLQALHFRAWGFHDLQIDQAQLGAGTVAVAQASGIMTDGLLFDIPKSDPAPPARPLAPHFEPDQSTLDIFLAIPHYREGGFNIATKGRDADTRYRAEVEMMRDENTGQSEKPVLIARKNFRLLVEGENREGFSTLRIATVEKSASGLFRLQPQFVPPLVEFRASDYLNSMARRLLEVLSSRSGILSGVRRQKNQTLADFTAADIPGFWLLYTVNSALPVFRHLLEARGGHPEELFGAMLSLAGALTTFSVKVHPRDFPAYDHDNLGACFGNLDAKLRLLLDTVVPSNFISLPLKLVQPSIYATSIDRDEYLANSRMYLAIKAETGPAELIARTPHSIKIASADLVDRLVQQALPGVLLSHVQSPPSAIPLKLGYQYFSLSPQGSPWESIGKSRNFAAYVPADFPNPQIELIILLPQTS
ncbi:MAG TPA: type VI secretion system baseplate subunit TssK [Candidatus Acidoferrales bacterium]|jgi:type VI secretion system protein ImpJ|nr:type VI secretion system baseplate subunit TssK [Candidatus Acidoferrales bacterium]